MNEILEIKKKLLDACQREIEGRINAIEERLKIIRESRDNETKSSAGDKYETGRAMMQMEEENIRVQHSEANKYMQQLSKLNIDKKFERAEPGSLVKLTNGVYFISIGLGEVILNNKKFFCISIHSPIGLKLRDKKKGEEFEFNGTLIKVEEIN